MLEEPCGRRRRGGNTPFAIRFHLGAGVSGFAIHPGLGVKTMAEMMDYAKKNPVTEADAETEAKFRRIVEIKRKKKADLADDDYAHMKKVVAYVRRHTAQGGPAKDKEHSDWRYSLMNWGHDPLK